MIQPPQSPQTGPYLNAAAFCEHVLDEKDNVKSLVRLIDRISVSASGSEPPGHMPNFELSAVLFLSFKAGDAHGPVPIKVTSTKPSGITENRPVWDGTVHFEGGTRGHNLILRMRMNLGEAGPYWFNVFVGDHLVTKVPLEVIYTSTRTTGQPPETQD